MKKLNFFDEPIENNLKTYDNIRKIATVQRHDYSTGCLLDYPYFREHYKLIAIDLSKQQKAIQQINFIGKPEKNAAIFFITEQAKETVLDF